MNFAPFEPNANLAPTRTAEALRSGPLVTPIQRIYLYNDAQWEEFTREWADFKRTQYLKVVKYAGAGDKGIDVAGFCDTSELLGEWDCFQCKHYGKQLNRSDGMKEIAKIIFFSHRGDYRAPRGYFFVAPRGLSTQFSQLLSNADRLRTALIEDWSKVVSVLPPGTSSVLPTDLKEHIQAYDFETFDHIPVPRLIEEHKETTYYLSRFGGGLGDRPPQVTVPDTINTEELRYTRQLFEAYSAKEGTNVDLADLKSKKKLREHFRRSRESFFEAESLRLFVREKVVPGTFESLQNEVHEAVADIHDDDEHETGFHRLQAVILAAQGLNLSAHALGASVLPKDQRGICHQLANEDRLTWVQE